MGFQDEARFGRVCDPKRCWSPPGVRPVVKKQIVREYSYAYGVVYPKTGGLDSVILPDMRGDTMEVFLKQISKQHPNDYILFMDGAPCHSTKKLKIPRNIEIVKLPPYSPQLNPAENVWHEMREKWFGNLVFSSLDAVISRMCNGFSEIK